LIEIITKKLIVGTQMRLQSKITNLIPTIYMNIAAFAVLHPFLFHFRTRKIIQCVRLFKCFAPLVGSCNKLKGSAEDLGTKMIQFKRRLKAKSSWKLVIDILYSRKIAENAAIRIQSNFRSRRARRALKSSQKRIAALRKIKSCLQDNGTSAKGKKCQTIERIQKRLRLRSSQNLSRVIQLRQEIHILERRTSPRVISLEEKHSFASLQKQTSTRNISNANIVQKLLLRPNTMFAVAWKTALVLCILLEIMQLLLAPHLSHIMGVTEKIPLDKLVQWILLPNSINPTLKPNKKMFGFVPLQVLLRKIAPTTSQRQHFYVLFYGIWCDVMLNFAASVVHIVQVVRSLDVFVTFFTGEIDPKTGSIAPKRWFKRWIFPGLALQLLVNPNVSSSLHFLKYIWRVSALIGHVRFYYAVKPILLITCAVIGAILDRVPLVLTN